MQFDDAFFKAVGLGELDDKRKQELGEQLAQLAQNQLALVVADRLTEEQLDQFNTIADEKGDDAAMAYVEEVLPDYQTLVRDQTTEVIEAFIGDMNVLLDQPTPDATDAKPADAKAAK